MSIFRLAFELFVLYMVYKLVFELIIPLVKTTNQVKKQFGDMNAKMEKKMSQQQQNATFVGKEASTQPKTKNEDYIDFEEVK